MSPQEYEPAASIDGWQQTLVAAYLRDALEMLDAPVNLSDARALIWAALEIIQLRSAPPTEGR